MAKPLGPSRLKKLFAAKGAAGICDEMDGAYLFSPMYDPTGGFQYCPEQSEVKDVMMQATVFGIAM